MKNVLHKFSWYLKNLMKLRPLHLDGSNVITGKEKKFCVVYIDYASLSDRKVKKVKDREFECGKKNIEILQNIACEVGGDFFCVVSRDNSGDRVSYDERYHTHYLDNGGTDISTLFTIRDFISSYDLVCICNSSAPCISLESYGREAALRALGLCANLSHFVIGLHGNSHSSPSLKFGRGKNPHVITSFFICRGSDLYQVLNAGCDGREEVALKEWGDKYFAIRNFELQLSNSVLSSGGTLSILGPQEFELTQSGGSWPNQDSRLRL